VRGDRSAAASDSRSDRTGRYVEHLGDLGVLERAHISKHDRGTELVGQCGERIIDGEAIDDVVGSVSTAARGHPTGQLVDG
jgi:hypothetical protein